MTGKQFDIVIVGGGMVGATLACALADTDIRIAVVDSAPAPEVDPSEYDLRVSAVTPGSKAIFEAIGIWSAMQSQRISCIDAMTVWDEAGSGHIDFDSAEMAQPCLGYIVENRVIRKAALDRMQALRNVEFLCPASVSEIRKDDKRISLQLDDGSVLELQLLVGADGANSRVRTWAGIDTRSWSFEQKAIVATVTTSGAHAGVARQRFLETGPLAFLPLDDAHKSSIVWSADNARADALLSLNDADFISELQASIADGPGLALGEVVAVSRRAAFPLTSAHADDYVSERVVLVGDAAHRIHPLAGQGLNLGLGDAAVLAEVLIDAAREGRDVGSLRILRRYERWRRGDNALMLASMDGFKRLFSNDHPVLGSLRNVGLDLADTLSPLKYRIMLYAAGLAGDRPKLMRGLRP
jgi:2-octaprenylphenol hydroxylase